jgi:DNA repair exonuclease SbcCD ATPase subunit
MRILSLQAENVKKLRAVEIIPAGNVVQITGANGSGKSSVLDCMWMALAGKSAVPTQPVRQGEESARIRLDLGDIIVTRKFDADGTTSLSVTTAEGAKFSSPQAMLDGYLGTLTFDPLAFSRMKPREQRDELARMAGLTTMLAQLSAADREDYETRTLVNREAKQAAARLAVMPAVEACEPVDVSATLVELRAARDHNLTVEKERLRRSQSSQTAKDWRAEAQRYREEAARMIQKADACEHSAQQEESAFSKAPAIAASIDTDAIEARIADAERINAQHRAYMERDALDNAVAELQVEADEITARMQAREAERAAVVQAANLPIDGLGLTDDGVTYRGLPLVQASSAEQLRVSVAIAMASNPKLRVLRIQDGSLLDEHSFALLEAMAQDNDFQVWVEQVDTSGTVGIVMEDGTARVASAAQDPTPRPRRQRTAGV